MKQIDQRSFCVGINPFGVHPVTRYTFVNVFVLFCAVVRIERLNSIGTNHVRDQEGCQRQQGCWSICDQGLAKGNPNHNEERKQAKQGRW